MHQQQGQIRLVKLYLFSSTEYVQIAKTHIIRAVGKFGELTVQLFTVFESYIEYRKHLKLNNLLANLYINFILA